MISNTLNKPKLGNILQNKWPKILTSVELIKVVERLTHASQMQHGFLKCTHPYVKKDIGTIGEI